MNCRPAARGHPLDAEIIDNDILNILSFCCARITTFWNIFPDNGRVKGRQPRATTGIHCVFVI